MIKDGYLPSTFTPHQSNYAVVDIETLENSINRQETDFLTTDANLYVVSIAVASNIEGKNPTFLMIFLKALLHKDKLFFYHNEQDPCN